MSVGKYFVDFYKDKNGYSQPLEYIKELMAKANTVKEARIALNKINDYFSMLEEYGTHAGEPYVKHIKGDIWELRPRSDRFFFACRIENTFYILHYYTKKSQKMSEKDFQQALRKLKDLDERHKQ